MKHSFKNWLKIQEMDYNVQNLDHFIGNPLFAIETNLNPLRKRIKEARIQEALEIVDEIQAAIEKAKAALAQVTHQPPKSN